MFNHKVIGNKIAEARKKINLSQAQLALRLFISSQAVGKWERGESMPDIITFNRLAEILGVDLNYFSESFHSSDTETILVEPSVMKSVEISSSMDKEKHSWDMSRGNWVDADFSGLKNLHEKFSSSNMQRCLFNDSDLSGLLLKNNNIDRCNFSSSNISGSRIQSSNLVHNQFNDCSLKETEFSKSNINVCNFSGAEFSNTKFQKNNYVESCDFSNSNFANSHIQHSFFNKNIFTSSSFKEAEFFESYFSSCDFSHADFTKIFVKSSGIEKSDITNVILNHTSFIDTQLVDLVFNGTIEDCYFENCKFTRVTFQKVILKNTFFKCKTLKRIRFIDCQADRMTYEFLKNGKADLSGIALLP